MAENQPGYPLTFNVDYPEKLDRLTTFLRLIWIIPIAIVLGTISGGSTSAPYAAGGILFAATLLLILFREKYPRWWFDWNLHLTRFSTRVLVYFYLLRDEYPSTDEEQAIHLDIRYPDVPRELNRFLPLIKWLLAIPHWIVLVFLYIGVFFAVIIAWFAILFTGRYPRSLFDYVVGVVRWSLRVYAYALLLTTDRYPPFSLS
jgi:hypothetical protein